MAAEAFALAPLPSDAAPKTKVFLRDELQRIGEFLNDCARLSETNKFLGSIEIETDETTPLRITGAPSANYDLAFINTQNGPTNSARMYISSGDAQVAYFTAGSGRTTPIVTNGPIGAQGCIRTLGQHPLVLGTSNTERVRIDSAGLMTVNNKAVICGGSPQVAVRDSLNAGAAATPFIDFQDSAGIRLGRIGILSNTQNRMQTEAINGPYWIDANGQNIELRTDTNAARGMYLLPYKYIADGTTATWTVPRNRGLMCILCDGFYHEMGIFFFVGTASVGIINAGANCVISLNGTNPNQPGKINVWLTAGGATLNVNNQRGSGKRITPFGFGG